MSTYSKDRSFTDRFENRIKCAIGGKFLKNDFYKDVKEATDLLMLRLNPCDFACRVRKFEYYQKYRNQFTIRYKRDTGSKTEFAKILDGFGDFMFYGFSNPKDDGSGFQQYKIINLDVLRDCKDKITNPDFLKKRTVLNYTKDEFGRKIKDGTYFLYFLYSDFPPEIIHSSYHVFDLQSNAQQKKQQQAQAAAATRGGDIMKTNETQAIQEVLLEEGKELPLHVLLDNYRPLGKGTIKFSGDFLRIIGRKELRKVTDYFKRYGQYVKVIHTIEDSVFWVDVVKQRPIAQLSTTTSNEQKKQA